ncbi:MAG: MBG domain-containing protein [Tannerella sp.]|nr:MBG domain-containing protein [Tannerella sp.]
MPPPTAAGTYSVTVDISEGANYTEIAGLSLGDYTIAVPPATAFDFTLSDPVYDGKPHPLTVTVNSGAAGLGPISAVKYNGNATVPTAAGTYAVTVNIAAGTVYAAINDLPIGSFTIEPAKPTLDVLDFDLHDIPCSGTPWSVPVEVLKDIEGLGEIIAIKYNGRTTVPIDPGEYTVTVDIATGANYAAVTNLPLGTFIILEPTVPMPTHYSVQFPSAEGLTTDPPAGTYRVNSGSNFTFTLTPDLPSTDGTPPQVQTNRRTPERPNASGIRITPNADGSYTVVILAIRQNIDVTLATAADSKSGPTANEAVAAGLTLSTAPGAIVVANSRPAPATLYVYSLAGTLVRLTTVALGTTRLSVPPGIYIVTDGSTFHRKTAVTRF